MTVLEPKTAVIESSLIGGGTTKYSTTTFSSSIGRPTSGVVSAPAYVVAWQNTDRAVIDGRTMAQARSSSYTEPVNPTDTARLTFTSDNAGPASTSSPSVGGTANNDNASNKHIATGTIIGIALLALAVVLMTTALIIFLRWRKRQGKSIWPSFSCLGRIKRKIRTTKFELDASSTTTSEIDNHKRFEMPDKSSQNSPTELSAARASRGDGLLLDESYSADTSPRGVSPEAGTQPSGVEVFSPLGNYTVSPHEYTSAHVSQIQQIPMAFHPPQRLRQQPVVYEEPPQQQHKHVPRFDI